MTTPYERVLKFLGKYGDQNSYDELEKRLRPQVPDALPMAPSLPRKPGEGEARLQALEIRTGRLSALRAEAKLPSGEELVGNIENYIGMAQVPVGLCGPLRLRGTFANGDFYVPMATSEGALVASYSRGARLVSQAGGITCISLPAWVQRAPGFAFESVVEAARFAAWTAGEFEAFHAAAATRTRHGELVQVSPHLEANHVHLILSFSTGEAAGQNMVTLCAEAICRDILARSPVKPKYWFVEANMSGDKKATVQSLLNTRGRKVIAEAHISKEIVKEGLHTSVERLCDYWRMSFVGGAQTGSIGVSGHVANGLAAVFLATGQDVACISEASIGLTRLEIDKNGDLYMGITLPNLIVGSLGGGSKLPTAQDCLRILGAQVPGGADLLAEVCAGVALCGELSIIGALCADEFSSAHERLGRGKK